MSSILKFMRTGKSKMEILANIIVNGDDFGYSELINKSILKAFKNNLISSITLMCNTPGFEETCDIAHTEKLIDKIGIHLDLSESQPLTVPIKKLSKFYKVDQIVKSFKGRLLNYQEKNTVLIEMQAQYDRCRKMGIMILLIAIHLIICTIIGEWADL